MNIKCTVYPGAIVCIMCVCVSDTPYSEKCDLLVK